MRIPSRRPSFRYARGFTLVETIMVVVLMSIVMASISISIDRAAIQSAETLPRKQALALAESLLDEVMSRRFEGGATTLITPDVAIGGAPDTNRTSDHDVSDYNNFGMSQATTGGIRLLAPGDPVIPSLSAFAANVFVTPVAFGAPTAPPATDAKRIVVTVTGPANTSVTLEAIMIKTEDTPP